MDKVGRLGVYSGTSVAAWTWYGTARQGGPRRGRVGKGGQGEAEVGKGGQGEAGWGGMSRDGSGRAGRALTPSPASLSAEFTLSVSADGDPVRFSWPERNAASTGFNNVLPPSLRNQTGTDGFPIRPPDVIVRPLPPVGDTTYGNNERITWHIDVDFGDLQVS